MGQQGSFMLQSWNSLRKMGRLVLTEAAGRIHRSTDKVTPSWGGGLGAHPINMSSIALMFFSHQKPGCAITASGTLAAWKEGKHGPQETWCTLTHQLMTLLHQRFLCHVNSSPFFVSNALLFLWAFASTALTNSMTSTFSVLTCWRRPLLQISITFVVQQLPPY